MTMFHKNLMSLTRTKNYTEKNKIIDEHMEAIKKEFRDQSSLDALLKEYYEVLGDLKEAEWTSNWHDKKHHTVKLFNRAHELSREIEMVIEHMHGLEHKFLK